MDQVNRTLFIPLYGKAMVSRKGIILDDPRAEEIWAAEGFPLKTKSRSKWLAYYMGMRSAVFDRWAERMIQKYPDAVVVHIGCGLDSRCLRIGQNAQMWYDIDFPDVMEERARFYEQTPSYRMIGADARDEKLFAQLPVHPRAIVLMEGVSMYLERSELLTLLRKLNTHFENVQILLDCYTEWSAKASRYKNPVNDVGVRRLYGVDQPLELCENTGLRFVEEYSMTPPELIEELQGREQVIFRYVFAGKLARKMYALYEYESASAADRACGKVC